MQGSMKTVTLLAATLLVALAALVYTGTSLAAPSRSSCSDLGYLNAALKSSKKTMAALKLAQRSRWSAALTPARQGLTLIKRSPTPCDEDGADYWLHRQYSIKYTVAFVRYLEESKQGDWDRADTYWSSVEFWGDEITDITYAW